MEGKTQENGTTFTKKNSRCRTGVVVGAAVLIAAGLVVMIVVLVNRSTDDPEPTGSDSFRYISVRSSGLVNRHVNLTVRYELTGNCFTSWLARQEKLQQPLFEDGGIRKISDTVMESSLSYENELTSLLLFRTYCEHFYTSIFFDMNALMTPGTIQEAFPDISEYRVTFLRQDTNQSSGDVTVEVTVAESINITEEMITFEAFVEGLNTSTNPFSVFEIVDDYTENSPIRFVPGNSREDGVLPKQIVVEASVAQYGGSLTVGMRKSVNQGFIRAVIRGNSYRIARPGTQEVVARGNFGIYRGFSETDHLVIYGNRYSFICAVMGNPVPTAEIAVYYPDDRKANIQPVLAISDDLYKLVFVTVDKSEFQDGGKFQCSASVGSEVQTIETVFSYGNFEHCVVNQSLTGVLDQSTQHDVLRCTAQGRPLPVLEIRLYDEFGPDLLKIDDFQVSRMTVGESAVTVNLTISPPNTDIHTVQCVCQQSDYVSLRTPKENQTIVLYSGKQNNYTLYNEFFRRIYQTP